MLIKLISQINHRYVWYVVNVLSSVPLAKGAIQKVYYSFFSYPKTVQIHLNSECNLKCKYCYSKKSGKLSSEKILRIIDEASKLGAIYIDFLGGEPLLYSKLGNILRYVHKKSIGITLYTNGMLINNIWISLFKEMGKNFVVAVKFDYNRQTYKKHTGKKQFNLVTANIKKCTENGIKTVAFIPLTKINAAHANDIARKSLQLGALPLFERYIPIRGRQTNRQMEINREDWHNVLEITKRLYSDFFPYIRGAALVRGNVCACYRDVLSIDVCGNVLPCPFSPKALSLGNVNRQGLKGIWSNFEKQREAWLELPFECSECKNRHYCGGGCKTFSYTESGNMGKDPYCSGDMPPTLPHCAFNVIHHTGAWDKHALSRLCNRIS